MSDQHFRESPYRVRNRRLRNIGYGSYVDFLNSPEWEKIRGKVLRHFKHRCWRCGGKATQIHHSRYNPGSLNGNNVAAMIPLCRPCHEFAEFDGPRKCSLDEANARLRLSLDRTCRRCGKACHWYSFLFADTTVCRCCYLKRKR